MNRQYTDDDIIRAVRESRSLAQVLSRIGLRPAGGNYLYLKKNIERLGLDTSHFLGQGHLRGKSNTWVKKVELKEVLEGRLEYTSTFHLKNRLLKEGFFIARCYECQLTEWRGRPIPLELEHRDGNRKNNSLDNLTLLCPNCHALTHTYRGRNMGR